MATPALTTQLGAPVQTDIIDGYNGFIRFWRHGQAVAAPGEAFSIVGADNVTADAPAAKISKDVYQVGGGSDYYSKRRNYQFNGVINMLAGAVPTFLSQALGVTYDLSNYVGLSLIPPTEPIGTIEVAVRDFDNRTHLGSYIYNNISLLPFNFGLPNEDSMIGLPFSCARYPIVLKAGAELCYDQFTGDGSTTDFTASSTPLLLLNSTLGGNEDFYLDNAFWVMKKASGALVGTRHVDLTFTTGTKALAFTDAAPAVDTVVQLLYPIATV